MTPPLIYIEPRGGVKTPPYSIITDISPNRGITRHYAKKYIACVGGDDSAPRCRGGFPCPPVDFDVILRNNTKVVPYGL